MIQFSSDVKQRGVDKGGTEGTFPILTIVAMNDRGDLLHLTPNTPVENLWWLHADGACNRMNSSMVAGMRAQGIRKFMHVDDIRLMKVRNIGARRARRLRRALRSVELCECDIPIRL